MKVILTRDVPQVGKDGDIVTVADGYARNYLFPRSLALVAKGNVMKQHTARLEREAAKTAGLKATAQQNAEKLEGQEFQIIGRAAPRSTRLFGSVTEADVAETIKSKLGIDVDKRRISLIDPIKVTGRYALTARLHTDVTASFSVEVVTQEQLDNRAREIQIAEEKAAKAAAAAALAEEQRLAAEAAREAARAAREAAGEPEPEQRQPRRVRSYHLENAPDAEG